MFDPKDIVGLTESEALVLVVQNNHTIRVLCQNGETLVGTSDFNSTRINVSVTDGIINSIISIG